MTVSDVQATAVAHAQQKRVPDFFIVGHMKSGTTALYDMLRRHPQIYMPHNKEPRFLASEMHGDYPPRPHMQGRTPETLEDYLSLFAAATPEQRVGEASALYLWSHTAAGRIAELQPAARIIAILREPASFLRSLHFQFVQVYVEPETDFAKAIALEEERRTGRHLPPDPYWPEATLYSEHVRYVEQLRRYHTHFAREQVLVLAYEDFRRDNEATVRKVQRFLEVDDTLPVIVRDSNPTVRVRSRRLYALTHALAAGEGALQRAVQATARTLAPRRLNRQSATAIRDRIFYSAPKPADEALMLELRRRFQGEVKELSEYLDRDFLTLWGYDRLQ
jgi:hypothetical protein